MNMRYIIFMSILLSSCSVVKTPMFSMTNDTTNMCVCSNKNGDVGLQVITKFDFDSVIERE